LVFQELTLTVYIKKNMHFKASYELFSNIINLTLCQDSDCLKIHESTGFKFYSFGSLYPTEKDGIYKGGSIYHLKIRSINRRILRCISDNIQETSINHPSISVVDISQKTMKQFFISELYSITPVIVTSSKNIFWTIEKDGDIVKLQKQLHDNLKKKYENFYNEQLENDQNFIQLLEIKNIKPQNIQLSGKGLNSDKNIRLFGNKFRIVPNEDEVSQKLAFLALGCGLGEKNSFGGGFCIAKGLRL